jgi:hypothetical protein
VGFYSFSDGIIKSSDWPWGAVSAKDSKPLSPYVLSFDGAGDYVGFGSHETSSGLAVQAVCTIELVMSCNSIATSCVVSQNNYSFGRHSRGISVRDTGELCFWTRNSLESWNQVQTINWQENTYHLLSLVQDASILEGYVDGVSVGSFDIGTAAPNYESYFELGSYTASDYFFSGTISEVRIWNTARTQAQIQDKMNKGLDGDETGLVAYYPMDEGFGTILYDATGNGNNATINGAVWIER